MTNRLTLSQETSEGARQQPEEITEIPHEDADNHKLGTDKQIKMTEVPDQIELIRLIIEKLNLLVLAMAALAFTIIWALAHLLSCLHAAAIVK